MKKILLVLIAISFASYSFGQVLTSPPPVDDGYRTIFEGEEVRISAFGGPMMSFTTVYDELSFLMGGGGAILVNGFYFGGYGQGLTNQIGINTNEHIEFGHGGFMTGFVMNGKNAVHPTFNSLIGWGNVSINEDGLSITPLDESSCFVFEPSIQLEMNLTRFFRLGIGGGYRLVSGLHGLDNLENKDFSGVSASISIKFGWF